MSSCRTIWTIVTKQTEFNQTQSNKRAYQLVLYLTLVHRSAKDWFTGDKIGFIEREDDWTREYKPEWHHIFPKAIVKSKKGMIVRDSMANFTAINKKTNRTIRDRKPVHYLPEVPVKQLKAHMVPVEEELWKKSKFVDFIDERAQKLSRGINRFISETGGRGLGK